MRLKLFSPGVDAYPRNKQGGIGMSNLHPLYVLFFLLNTCTLFGLVWFNATFTTTPTTSSRNSSSPTTLATLSVAIGRGRGEGERDARGVAGDVDGGKRGTGKGSMGRSGAEQGGGWEVDAEEKFLWYASHSGFSNQVRGSMPGGVRVGGVRVGQCCPQCSPNASPMLFPMLPPMLPPMLLPMLPPMLSPMLSPMLPPMVPQCYDLGDTLRMVSLKRRRR
ncbi:unnamed protein product [Closterium sp. NIES-54]